MKKLLYLVLLFSTIFLVIGCKKGEYVIKFESNGGSAIADLVVKAEDNVTKPTDPVKENYSFAGWYIDSKFKEEFTLFGSPIKKNYTLYAKWTENEKFEVKFITNCDEVVNDQFVYINNKVKKPEDFKRKGFTFEGWYLDSEFIQKYDFNKEVTSNLTLYAKWTELESYEVVFVTNCDTTLNKKIVYVGEKLTKPEDIVYNGYIFEGWYIDQKFEKLFDFDKVLTSDITLYAKWKEDAIYAVYSVDLPKSYSTYLVNKQQKMNKQTEFFDLTKNYLVGIDNAFNVKPILTFIKKNNQTGEIVTDVDVDSWSFTLKLYMLVNDSYELVTDNNLYIDSFDAENCLIDFNKEALNKKIKVQIIPNNLTDKQKENIDKYTMEIEVEVIEGYNVYNEIELAYIENRTSGDDAEAWKLFKQNNGLNVDYSPKNIILHNNLLLTKDYVPNYYFYQASELSKGDSDYNRALGSMKDFKNMYCRNMNENEEFTLQGNYFTINSSQFREVVREDGKITTEGEVISHATLMRFEGNETGKSTINNLNIIGNAPRVENVIKSGGQIFVKVEGPKFVVENCISTCFFITYFPESTKATFDIVKCKAYDAFNSFVYNWGSDKVTIDSCEMIGAGGPIIIQDHVEPNNADGGRVAKTVVKNSKLESYVAGSEGWFTIVKASALVPLIKQLDQLFNPFQRSFLKQSSKDPNVTYMNLICVNKSGSAQGVTAEKIKGSLKIDDYMAFDFGETNPYIKAMLDQTFVQNAPAFQTSSADLTSGYAYTDGKSGLFDLSNNLITDVNNNIYKGNYLCLYYNGMALTMGYNVFGDVQQIEE